MRITIDTVKDSQEEIQKAISFLKDFVGGTTVSEEEASVSGDTMMNMFGDAEKEGEENSEETPEDLAKLTPY